MLIQIPVLNMVGAAFLLAVCRVQLVAVCIPTPTIPHTGSLLVLLTLPGFAMNRLASDLDFGFICNACLFGSRFGPWTKSQIGRRPIW